MAPQSGGPLGWDEREELSAELVDPHLSLNIVPIVMLLNPVDMVASRSTIELYIGCSG